MKQISPKAGMTIEFTYEELKDLITIVGSISGNHTFGPRVTATNLYRLLDDAGVRKSEVQPLQSMKFPID